MTEKETATRIAWVWIENDEGLYNGVYARAREIAKESARPADDLADFIREYLDGSAPRSPRQGFTRIFFPLLLKPWTIAR